MHALMHMDWPSRLAWGLLAWPVMIILAVLLSRAADPRELITPWVVAIVGAAELVVAAVASVFPIWSLIAWAEKGDEPGTPPPKSKGTS
jgi:hypothetical protein